MDDDGVERPPPPPEPATRRNWADLPHDVVYEVLCRLPHMDVLNGAGLVCASWRRLAVDEPMLWRHIDIAYSAAEEFGVTYPRYWYRWCSYLYQEYLDEQEIPARVLAMARAAVDRSKGRCESFRGPVDCHLLLYLATNAPSLSSLHVTSFFRLHWDFVHTVVPKLAMLERLVLTRGITTTFVLRAFVDHCPRLELLDAGGCYLEASFCPRLLEWLSEVKILTLPRQVVPVDSYSYGSMLEKDYFRYIDEFGYDFEIVD